MKINIILEKKEEDFTPHMMFDPNSDDKKKAEHGHGHSHDHAHGEEHAKIVALGTVTFPGCGATFTIDRDGQVESGKETEFGVELVGGGGAVPTAAWLANPDGTKVSEPALPEGHDQHWHLKVEPLMYVMHARDLIMLLRQCTDFSTLTSCIHPCAGLSKSPNSSCRLARRSWWSTMLVARSQSTAAFFPLSKRRTRQTGADSSS